MTDEQRQAHHAVRAAEAKLRDALAQLRGGWDWLTEDEQPQARLLLEGLESAQQDARALLGQIESRPE